jgi:hypothetical protein
MFFKKGKVFLCDDNIIRWFLLIKNFLFELFNFFLITLFGEAELFSGLLLYKLLLKEEILLG